MLPHRQFIAVTVVGLIMLVLVLGLIRQGKIREKYALLWIFIGLVLISVPWIYDFYLALARFLGIQDPISFFFFFAIVGITLLCLQITIALTSAYEVGKTLTQHQALLEQRIETLEKKLEAGQDHQNEQPGEHCPNRTSMQPNRNT